MRTMRWPLVVLLLGCGSAAAAIENGPIGDPQAAVVQPVVPAAAAVERSSPGVDASSVYLPCTPVAAYWTGPPLSEGMPPGPELGIVDVDVRPKDARVHLDDRFVGRSKYLDGTPGYLYLAPGLYRLELRLEGYRTVSIDLDVQAGCRYDLKHRLERVPGSSRENTSEHFGKGKPFNRVFAPVPVQGDGAAGGPDPSLRPDIGRTEPPPRGSRPAGASLRIHITPEEASIAIDGAFVAFARELKRMEAPLAVSSGSHRVEVSAPGYESLVRSIELDDGEVMELSFDLVASSPSRR